MVLSMHACTGAPSVSVSPVRLGLRLTALPALALAAFSSSMRDPACPSHCLMICLNVQEHSGFQQKVAGLLLKGLLAIILASCSESAEKGTLHQKASQVTKILPEI